MEAFTFSKKGDQGETSLLSGRRVSKASLRPEAYGTLDEAASVLGMAKALTQNATIRDMIGTVQEDLLALGAGLACETPDACAYLLGPERASRLEKWNHQIQEEAPLPRCFICPGANVVGATLDLARTVIRRSERRVMALREAEQWVDAEAHAYLNRLADFLFTLARYADRWG